MKRLLPNASNVCALPVVESEPISKASADAPEAGSYETRPGDCEVDSHHLRNTLKALMVRLQA